MDNKAKKASSITGDNIAKPLVSVLALALVIFRIIWPNVQIDMLTLGLVLVAVLPWLSTFIQSAKLPGGWELEFRELQENQEKQQHEINTLQFLISHFVTDYELHHLKALASDGPFTVKKDETSQYFEDELRRLRSLGLIINFPGKGIRQMFNISGEIDVKEHLRITDLGREYLELRKLSEEKLTR